MVSWFSVMFCWCQVTELAGYTSRVAQMFEVFSDMQKGNYVRSRVPAVKQGTRHQKVTASLLQKRGKWPSLENVAFCWFYWLLI